MFSTSVLTGFRSAHRWAIRIGFRVAYRRSRVGRRYRELEQSQWQPQGVLLQQQWHKLQRLVQHAYDEVPFYRQRMDKAGLHPRQITSPEDYRRLPLLTKDDLRAHREELVALSFPRNQLISNGSGGSTGAPVRFYHDRAYTAGTKAVKLRNFRWAGWEPGDAWARLWGNPLDLAPHQRVAGRLSERLTRVRWLSSFDMTPETMSRYAKELAAFRPDVLEAYVNPLYVFAQYLEAHGLSRSIRPKGIIVSAETLYDYQRTLIEDVFACKVFNRYGGREAGDIAHECESGGLHLNTETVYTEFIRDGEAARPGEPGEVILTPLDLYGMPMLRYQVEDVGSPAEGTCPCGRGLPLMEMVQGRVQDLIVTRSGRVLTGLFFAHLLKDFDVLRFQVIQEAVDNLDVYIVPGVTLGEEALMRVRQSVEKYTGRELAIRFHMVTQIPLSASGKHRFTVSKLPNYLAHSKDPGRALM